MEKQKLLQQTQSRDFFGHHMLLHASELQVATAKASEDGRFNHCLAAMTMTSLAIEALANAVGGRIVENWAAFERLSPLEKIVHLQEKLGFEYDLTKSPWPTIRYLCGFRNDIAHAKPEAVEETKIFSEVAASKFLFHTPLSRLEKEITVGNATRSLEAVQNLKGILTDALPAELRFGIYADAWSGDTSSTSNA
ncbi:hypothetical protein [Aquabacterium sp.]|uniref:hypothetical protein n=1 Tax=Aquabacterium sp. TaxID=1872578 RepID=UPI00403821F8